MAARRLVLWTLLWGALSVPRGVEAAYTASLRWAPNGDAGTVGYRVYTRTLSGAWGAPQDAGLPAPGGDGTLSAAVSGLDVRTDYAFAVSAYRSDGTESAKSNERSLTYAQVAPHVDSDGDGLKDAQEDVNLNRAVDSGETDPLNPDTDGDGVRDAADTCRGTPSGQAVNPQGCSCSQIVCNDGNACNGVETCSAGVCSPGTAPNCNDGNACTTDTCNPTSGCQNTPIAGCTACSTAAQCDDGNSCTTDTCSGGRCVNTAVANGTACSDGNVCNGNETCQNGACTAGTALNCNDGNACTTDTCNPTGGCQNAPMPGCVPCSTAAQCNDGNPCTSDSCSGGRCTNTARTNGSSCSDGNACNGAETCQSGTCTAGTPLACNDGDSCTTDACSPTSGCTYTRIAGCTVCTGDAACDDGNPCTADTCGSDGLCRRTPLPAGSACNDGDLCNGLETCDGAGRCMAGTALVCDDGNPCTSDSCDPTGGCRQQPITGCCRSHGECADTNPCTTNERCEANRCVADPLVCPAPTVACQQSVCLPDRGCALVTAPDGTSCDDGNVCTTGERCVTGSCTSGTSAAALPMATLPAARGRAPSPTRVGRFVLRPDGRGRLRFSLDAMLPPRPATESEAPEFAVELRTTDGTPLLDAVLGPADFERVSRGFRWGRGRDCEGLCRAVLMTSPRSTRVLLSGSVPSFAMSEAASATGGGVRSAGAASTFLRWSFKLGKSCANDVPTTCSLDGRGWRRCR